MPGYSKALEAAFSESELENFSRLFDEAELRYGAEASTKDTALRRLTSATQFDFCRQ